MKSTAAFVLVLIGGIFAIIGSIGNFISFLVLSSNPLFQSFAPSFLTNLGLFYPILTLVIGIVLIWASFGIRKDEKIKRSGIIALVAGVIGINILAIIGSIIAIVKAGKTETPVPTKEEPIK